MKTGTLMLFISLMAIGTGSAQSDPSALTRDAMTRYLESQHTDLSMLDEDVVFTNMATGEEHVGPEAVGEMLHFVYHVAFDAKAEKRSLIIEDNHAALEADIVGTHIGEFAGVPATNKSVRIPLCVVYDLERGMITHARIYFEMAAFMAQVKD